MAETDYHRGDMDITAQRSSYSAIMKFVGFIGVPGALALTAFFTALLLDLGWWAPVIFLVVFGALHFLIKLFFAGEHD